MREMVTVKVDVLESSPLKFGGEHLYRKGETYYGVMDVTTNVALIAFKFGNQYVTVGDSIELLISIQDDLHPGSKERIKTINSYLKTISLSKWIDENVKGKFNIYNVIPTVNTAVVNNVDGNGGNEFVFKDRRIFAIQRVEGQEDSYLVQIRKGAIFYLNTDFGSHYLETIPLESLDYPQLKEVKFMIDNDYKYGRMS